MRSELPYCYSYLSRSNVALQCAFSGPRRTSRLRANATTRRELKAERDNAKRHRHARCLGWIPHARRRFRASDFGTQGVVPFAVSAQNGARRQITRGHARVCWWPPGDTDCCRPRRDGRIGRVADKEHRRESQPDDSVRPHRNAPGFRRVGANTSWRWRRDLNPRSVLADSRFQGECIRPLCHATVDKPKRSIPARVSRAARRPAGRH